MDLHGTNTGNRYRLSVCLKRFFSDERARCYLLADPGLLFRELASRVQHLFDLTEPFYLVSRGHLLPPEEPVDLLSSDDLVEVIPKSQKNDRVASNTAHSELIQELFELETPRASDPVTNIQPRESAEGNLLSHEQILRETTNLPRFVSPIPEISDFYSHDENSEAENEEFDDLQNAQNDNHDNIENIETMKRKASNLLVNFPVRHKKKRVRRHRRYTTSQEDEDTE